MFSWENEGTKTQFQKTDPQGSSWYLTRSHPTHHQVTYLIHGFAVQKSYTHGSKTWFQSTHPHGSSGFSHQITLNLTCIPPHWKNCFWRTDPNRSSVVFHYVAKNSLSNCIFSQSPETVTQKWRIYHLIEKCCFKAGIFRIWGQPKLAI